MKHFHVYKCPCIYEYIPNQCKVVVEKQVIFFVRNSKKTIT